MIPVAAGIAHSYRGTLVLAGGTQMLAVCSVIKAMNGHVPVVATTSYVRDDHTANMQELAAMMDICIYYIDPGFGELGHDGLARVLHPERSRKVRSRGSHVHGLGHGLYPAPDQREDL